MRAYKDVFMEAAIKLAFTANVKVLMVNTLILVPLMLHLMVKYRQILAMSRQP